MANPDSSIAQLKKQDEVVVVTRNGEKLFVVAVVIMLLLLGFVHKFIRENSMIMLWIKPIHFIVFIALGVVHAYLLENCFTYYSRFIDKLLFSIKLFMLIGVALFLIYFYTDKSFLLLSIADASIFLLPFVLVQAWTAYSSFAGQAYEPWYSQNDSRKEVPVFTYGVPLLIKLSVQEGDKQKKTYHAKVPLSMGIGEFFNYFLLMQNNNFRQNIAVTNHQQKPFGWLFYEEKFAGLSRRQLDPEANSIENKIAEQSIIIAVRVTNEDDED